MIQSIADLNLLAGIFILLFGVYVYNMNKHSKTNRLFLVLSIIEMLWCFFTFQMRHSFSISEATVWLKMSSIWAVELVLFFSFIIQISKTECTSKLCTLFKSLCIVAPGVILFLVDSKTNYLSGNLQYTSAGWSYELPINNWVMFNQVWTSAVFVLCLFVIFRSYRCENKNRLKNQFYFVGMGILIYIVLFTLGAGLISDDNVAIPEFFSMAYLLKNIFIWNAIRKYEFFKIKVEDIMWDLADDIADGIVVATANGEISRYNKSFVNLFDDSEKSYAGKNIETLINIEDRQQNQKNIISNTIEDNQKALSVSISQIYGPKKQVIGLVYIIKDVSEQQEYERKLERKNLELVEKNELLLKTQKKLIASEKMATIGQLSAGLAHEINNPIGFVKSNVQTLEDYFVSYRNIVENYHQISKIMEDTKKVEYRKYIDKMKYIEDENNLEFINEDLGSIFCEIDDGIGRVTDLVKGLREFSHPSIEGQIRQYNLNYGITSALLLAKNRITDDIQVDVDLAQLPDIEVIGNQIDQVLVNLIVNAVDAIEMGGKNLKILKIKSYESDDNVCFEIEDNGIGMDEKQMEDIYNPFYTTKEIGKGTGLGMSIVYDFVVNKHSGEIEVESEIGKGTKFMVTLLKKMKVKDNDERA